MKRSDFNFDLPEQLIAQYPLENRADSRLLCLDRTSGCHEDRQFKDLPDLLRPGDLLIFNDTRVIPARLFGEKETGGKVEILVERITGDKSVIAQIKASKSPRPGSRIKLEDGHELIVEGREQDFFRLVYTGIMPIPDLLQACGHIPLPPYIKREDAAPDYERYQTVYARQPGAIAAPTAGLHFSDEILALLKQNKIDAGFVTLHVGAGTFQPVRVDNIEEHRMHSEWFSINEDLCRQIIRTRSAGGRVIAVGTTVVRCLESAAKDNHPNAITGETDIFIYPGYEFKLVDGLITNFHLPESTLLMLVSAFAGKDNVQRAYAHAVTEKYRFFSYGDAMLIL